MNDTDNEGGFTGFLRDILRGGLPEALDFPVGGGTGDSFTEQRPPQDVQTRENANLGFGFDVNLGLLGIVALVVGGLAVFSFTR